MVLDNCVNCHPFALVGVLQARALALHPSLGIHRYGRCLSLYTGSVTSAPVSRSQIFEGLFPAISKPISPMLLHNISHYMQCLAAYSAHTTSFYYGSENLQNRIEMGEIAVRENYAPVYRYSKYRYTGAKDTGRPKRRSRKSGKSLSSAAWSTTSASFGPATGCAKRPCTSSPPSHSREWMKSGSNWWVSSSPRRFTITVWALEGPTIEIFMWSIVWCIIRSLSVPPPNMDLVFSQHVLQ